MARSIAERDNRQKELDRAIDSLATAIHTDAVTQWDITSEEAEKIRNLSEAILNLTIAREHAA